MGIDEENPSKTALRERLTKHLAAIDLASSTHKSILDAGWVFPANSAIQGILEGIKHDEALMRSAVGPLSDLRRVGVFDHSSPLFRELDVVRRAMADWEARFHLPQLTDATRLLVDFQASS